ncbi:hypothetical protein MRX96_040992 [Rhipicephalus microplus]
MKIASPPGATPRSPGWSQDVAPVPYSKRLVCVVVFAVAAGLVVSVVALFYVFAMVTQIPTKNGDGDRSGERVNLSCRTDGCSRFEALLADSLNTSVDPCHDFKAYVSSRWLPDPSSELDYQWRYKWDVKYAWMRMMADEIRLRSDTSTLERLMADSFGACAHRASENAVDTRKKFKQLMHDLSVPWPETPPRDVDPFEAHLNLSIRWNIPLWFDVKMLPADTSRANKFIYIYPSAYAKFWKGEYDAITSQGSMRQYVNQYIEYFYHELTPNSSGQAADICRCDAVFNFTRHVVFQLARVDAKQQSVAVLGFGSLARAFGLTTERLVSLLNDYFRPKNLSFFDPRGPGTREGDEHAGRRPSYHHGDGCLDGVEPPGLVDATGVESSFKLLLLVTHMDVHFRSQQQRNIHDLLTSVREAALAEYKKSHLPADVKKLLTGKLRRLRINLWPRPQFRSAALLRQIYSFEYASKKTMLDYWISERRGNAALIGSSAYFEDKRLPHGNSKDTFSYDSILDTVSLSMVAVHEPFYYTDDDAFGAINYGGLGASFAMTLQEGSGERPGVAHRRRQSRFERRCPRKREPTVGRCDRQRY